MPLANKDISSMEHILNCTFGKIFIVKQQEIINECRKAFSFDNLNQIIKNRQLKFIAKLPVSNNIICRLISLYIILLLLFAIILSCNYYTILGLLFTIIVYLSDLYVYYVYLLPVMA